MRSKAFDRDDTHQAQYIRTFRRAFTLEGVDPSFPSGTYELVTDEELTEDFRFLRHRHIVFPDLYILEGTKLKIAQIAPLSKACPHDSTAAPSGSSPT